VPSLIVYFVLLARIDRIAMSRRETMATELCRVQAQ